MGEANGDVDKPAALNQVLSSGGAPAMEPTWDPRSPRSAGARSMRIGQLQGDKRPTKSERAMPGENGQLVSAVIRPGDSEAGDLRFGQEE